MSDRIAHRFVATWTEQAVTEVVFADTPLDAAGRTVATHAPQEILAAYAEAPPDALRAVVELAKAEGLPTFQRTISFKPRYPLCLNHLDEVGTVLETTGDGRSFRASGWVRAECFVMVASLAQASTGSKPTAAEIIDIDGRRTLVTDVDCLELSVVSDGALAGTTFSLGGPERVPDWDWARLGWDLPAGYHRDPGDTLRWSAAMADRQEVADHRGIVCKAE